MAKSNWKAQTLAASILWCVAVAANGQTATVGDLADVQGRAVMAKAKLNLATIEEELREKTRSAGATVGEDLTVPSVRLVYGVGKDLYATLVYANGATVNAKAGDTVLGNFKVLSISTEKVEMLGGGKRIQAIFAATPPVRPAAPEPQQQPQPPQFVPPMPR